MGFHKLHQVIWNQTYALNYHDIMLTVNHTRNFIVLYKAFLVSTECWAVLAEDLPRIIFPYKYTPWRPRRVCVFYIRLSFNLWSKKKTLYTLSTGLVSGFIWLKILLPHIKHIFHSLPIHGFTSFSNDIIAYLRMKERIFPLVSCGILLATLKTNLYVTQDNIAFYIWYSILLYMNVLHYSDSTQPWHVLKG